MSDRYYILVDREGWTGIYESSDALVAAIELYDAFSGEYLIFDEEGRRHGLHATDAGDSSFALGPSDELEPERLREILVTALVRHAGIDSRSLVDQTLTSLITLGRKHHRGRWIGR